MKTIGGESTFTSFAVIRTYLNSTKRPRKFPTAASAIVKAKAEIVGDYADMEKDLLRELASRP
jgi:hypothetical protein